MNVSKSHVVWAKLIQGTVLHEFKVVSASLMFSRLRRSYAANPTPANLAGLTDEAFGFFTKFEGVLQEDIKTLFS